MPIQNIVLLLFQLPKELKFLHTYLKRNPLAIPASTELNAATNTLKWQPPNFFHVFC